MKNIAVYSFTEKGNLLGKKISGLKFPENSSFKIEHFHNSETPGGVRARLPLDFINKEALIFISSTGIAVRMIKDYIKNKAEDPAVIVIDDLGRFVISLLSGHLGGANEFSEKIAKQIDALSIITTASDSRRIDAVDIFAKKNSYRILSMEAVKKITALMVDGKTIGFYSDNKSPPINYPELCFLTKADLKTNLKAEKKIEGLIIISNEKAETLCAQKNSVPIAHLQIKNLNIGIGLRKGVHKNIISTAVKKALNAVDKEVGLIKAIASIELKNEEDGLLEFAKDLKINPIFFSQTEIKKIEDGFEKSDFVKRTVGVYNVSAPCAYLLGGKIILDKFKHDGVTVSIAEE